MTGQSSRDRIVEILYRDRVKAHEFLFPHRRPKASPGFHRDMILDWHGPEKYLCELAFRGSAKTTISEEAIAIQAIFKEFSNCIIFGANFDLAAQRLHAIRREFENNAQILQIFGSMWGQPWGDDVLELNSGVVIRAMGRGQALRGTKGEVERPDLIYADDIEDEKSVSTEAGREKIQKWFLTEAIPAMADPDVRRVRISANALHPECLAVKLKSPDSGFVVHTTPWVYLDENGDEQSAWPERYPLDFIHQEKAKLYALGRGQEYESEFMCEPTSSATRPFKLEMFRIEPQVRTWQAVYSMTDPARTVSSKAADTGHVVWSWIGPKLVIWDAAGQQLMPDKIVDLQFQIHEDYHPVWQGIEEDGLNQFLLQPLRQEQVKRGVTLPLKPLKAPHGKLDFIRGLQPFFMAREVQFAKPLPDLQTQLLGFPTGKIDVPNALAYALRMRPGAPLYDDFGGRHVGEDLRPLAGRPVWLCLNATRAMVTGVLLQVLEGSVRIYADYVREGEPAAVLSDLVADASLDAGQRVRLTAGPKHFDQYLNVGLRQAAGKLPMEVRPGVQPERARSQLRNLLQREKQGMPMVLVSSSAVWTLNAFAGGYSRVLLKQGQLADYAEEGPYRVLMEGLESFLALMELGRSTDDEDDGRFNAVTHDGRRYTSMLGNR